MRRYLEIACVWLATFFFVGMILWPPWIEGSPSQFYLMSHAPLWAHPRIAGLPWNTKPDYPRLLIEIAAGEAIFLAAYLTISGKIKK